MEDRSPLTEDHTRHYTERGFWDKLRRYARQAGEQVTEKALTLYFAAESPDTPAWAKSVIYGALGYFILPTDAIPDVIPAVGYSDDLGAIAAALGAVAFSITPEVKERARGKMNDWFG